MSMGAECCGTVRPRKGWLAIALSTTPAALLAAVLPKCPLCLSAQLALLGIGVALPASGYALIVAASAALGAGVLILARRARI